MVILAGYSRTEIGSTRYDLQHRAIARETLAVLLCP